MQTMTPQRAGRKVLYARIFFAVMALVLLLETLVGKPLFGAGFWWGMFATMAMVALALQAEILFMPVSFKRLQSYKHLKYRKAADKVTMAAFGCMAISGLIALLQWLQAITIQ